MTQQRFALHDFARPLFSAHVALGWADPTAPMPRLMGDEVLAIDHVAPARAREFGAGRAAARQAMEALGQPPRPILQGDDRAPIWPAGLTGSITHTERDALAVVSDDPEIRALGLDMEPATPLCPELWDSVCTLADRRWLASLGPTQRGYFAKLVFCAKEAVYKAQYQISRTVIDFHAVTLVIDLHANRFTAVMQQEVEGIARGSQIDGRFSILGNAFISAVELRDHAG